MGCCHCKSRQRFIYSSRSRQDSLVLARQRALTINTDTVETGNGSDGRRSPSWISFQSDIGDKHDVFIDDDLTCPICISKFDDIKFQVRILPCGHTLCNNCVLKMCKLHSYKYLKCPQDRKLHRTKNMYGNADDLSLTVSDNSAISTHSENEHVISSAEFDGMLSPSYIFSRAIVPSSPHISVSSLRPSSSSRVSSPSSPTLSSGGVSFPSHNNVFQASRVPTSMSPCSSLSLNSELFENIQSRTSNESEVPEFVSSLWLRRYTTNRTPCQTPPPDYPESEDSDCSFD